MDRQPSLSASALLQHESFVRAVVRGLVSDEERVHDVVQETWLAALRRPPRVQRSLRSWLARVAGNLARDSHRSAGRRLRREVVAARPEAVESVDATHERVAAQREVVDAILSLREPYTSVVLLRYYQDLRPTEIAERLGRSPATVRSQLSRAHEILRDALNEKFEGGRSAWVGLLLPLGSAEVPAGKLGTGATIKIAAAAVGIAAVAIGVVPVLTAPGGSGASSAATGRAAAEPPEPVAGRAAAGGVAGRAWMRRPAGAALLAIAPPRRARVALAQDRPPLERDLWYAYVDGEVRYGSHHVRVSALSDGNYHYQFSFRALVDLFASQPQEVRVDGAYVVTPQLRPVSLDVELGHLSGATVVTGRRSGDALLMSLDHSGVRREKSIALDPAGTVLFSVSVDDWLARLDPAAGRARAKIIDETTGEVEEFVATCLRRDATGSDWQLDSVGGYGDRTLTLDAQGALVEELVRAPRQHLVRCTAEEARELAHRNMDGPEVLTFPLDRPIPFQHRLEELVVKLTWRDVPFGDFRLEDARQELVEQSEADGARSAVLRITAPPAVTDAPALPIRDAELARYLAETEYIKPDDPNIVAAAREAIAGAADSAEAVAALSKWVYGYVEGELIAETLTGPEVLAGRKGKCTEYSTLFASMARAVGIPTRIALGERMVGDLWMGHMWNEAWVGRWVPVDASADEVGRSFQLLKFVHSDTVEGTQPLRWALTDSLSIAIEDFRHAESELAGRYETGIDGVSYTNVDYEARLTAPSADWTVVDDSDSDTAVIGFAPPEAEGVAIHFVAFSGSEEFPPQQFLHARSEHFRGQFDSFEVLAEGPREVRGTGGHTTHARGRDDGDDQTVLITEVGWTRGPVGYLLTINGWESAHDAWLPHFESLVASFRFLDE